MDIDDTTPYKVFLKRHFSNKQAASNWILIGQFCVARQAREFVAREVELDKGICSLRKYTYSYKIQGPVNE